MSMRRGEQMETVGCKKVRNGFPAPVELPQSAKIAQECVEAGRETVEQVAQLSAPAAAAIVGATKNAVDGVKAQVDATTEAGRDTVSYAKQRADEAIQTMKENVNAMVEQGKDAVQAAKAVAGQYIPPDTATYSEALAGTVVHLVEGAKKSSYVQSAATTVTQAKDAVTKETEVYVEAGKKTIHDVKNLADSYSKSARETVSKTSESINSAVSHSKEVVVTVKKSVNGYCETVVDNGVRKVVEAKEGVKRNVDHYVASGKVAVEDIKTRVVPYIDEGKQRLSSRMEPAVQKIQSFDVSQTAAFTALVYVVALVLGLYLQAYRYASDFTVLKSLEAKVLDSKIPTAVMTRVQSMREVVASVPVIGERVVHAGTQFSAAVTESLASAEPTPSA